MQDSVHNDENSEQTYDHRHEVMITLQSQRVFAQPSVTKMVRSIPLSVNDLAELLFLKEYEGTYQNFLHYFQVELAKGKDYSQTSYEPSPDFGNQQTSSRTITFQHPVRVKTYFSPEYAPCIISDTIDLFDQKEVLCERILNFSNIPLADCFRVRFYYHLTSTGENTCSLEQGFYVEFMKWTLWGFVIESSTKSENVDLWENRFFPALELAIAKIKQQSQVIKDGERILQEDIISDSPIV